MIILYFVKSLKEVFVGKLVLFFVMWVKNGKSVNCKYGVFMMDFVEMVDFILSVIDLNY